MKRKLLAATLVMVLCTSMSFAQQAAPNPGKGLAVGQNPKLLQSTRDSNAGAGNGGEFIKVKGSFSVIGCSAHNMSGCFSSKYVEIDPGNAGQHNQSPECDYLNCTFDPHGS